MENDSAKINPKSKLFQIAPKEVKNPNNKKVEAFELWA